MKNYIIIAIIAIAGISQSAEYAITKNITTTKNQEVTVVATTFVLERFSAIVDREVPMFLIQGSYKDVSGTVLEHKTIRVTMEQAIQIMPSITNVMDTARSAVEANIQMLLAEDSTNLLAQIRASTTPQQALSYVSQCTEQLSIDACYLNAFMLTPKEGRTTFVNSITPGSVSQKTLLYLQIHITSDKSIRNMLLKEYYSFSGNPARPAKLFDTSKETKEGCIEFYELVLKNVTLIDRTKDDLGYIKGELLKLKGM